jgi:hypothetical protein
MYGNNGRVQINPTNQNTYSDYNNVYERNKVPKNFACDVTKNGTAMTPVSEIFFSEVNVNALQQGIKNRILNKSKGKYSIGDQSVNELLLIMKGIYTNECIHLNTDYLNQVRKLNESVLDFAVPRIFIELQMRDKYLQDISTLPVPMSHGENTNVAGTKQLGMRKFI